MKNILKDYTEVLGYKPSTYQEKIFDFVVHGHGNGVIKARAGSGKTKTMITCMKLLPATKTCLFLAFNKSVKEEISNHLKDYANCTVKTVHGLGYSIMSTHLNNDFDIDEYKYHKYLRNNIKEMSKVSIKGKNKYSEYIDRILTLLNFARMDLAQSEREIKRSAITHSVDVKYDEPKIVLHLMKWGKNELKTLDYTDLVWLPNELNVTRIFEKYDWIFNDEAQDYTIAYVNLFMKCFKRGTRFMSCGDEFQSINQFAGASDEAFNLMINHRNTETFYLPISYRCDKQIIKMANTLVDDIVSRDTAAEGTFIQDGSLKDIKGNDMVLCRTNAPLFKLYGKLIKLGKPCYIKGMDNDRDKLIRTIDKYSTDDELGQGFKTIGLFPNLYHEMIDERNRLVHDGMDMTDAIFAQSVQQWYDLIATLDTIATDCNTVQQLKEKIVSIYSDTATGICLTTIHKAKGLEADNVHLLCRSELPSKFAKTTSEIQQENNLLYVAITRAKHNLTYISEKEFPSTRLFNNENDLLTEFNYIEAMVCKLFGTSPLKPIINTEIAKVKVGMAKKIESVHANDNKKAISAHKRPDLKRKGSLLDKLLQ